MNQRSITDAIMKHGYSKQKFLDWLDKKSKFLQKDIDMIHEILDNWVEPEVTAPTSQNNETAATADTKANTAQAQDTSSASADDGDFDSVFGTDGTESDEDLFGTSASKAGSAAKVSAAEAKKRIETFDFSI